MEEALREIIELIKTGQQIDAKRLDKLLRAYNAKTHDAFRTVSKKNLLPYYLREREANSQAFTSWMVDDSVHDAIVTLLRAKPRRTASGVAIITVLTKPWPCGSNCVYCPNDIRMPKSYLADEPACQRAERCCFDPYLQVAARLGVLESMGHNTDKVELIVLGGTFSDYAPEYQRWYICELFRALNDFGTGECDIECASRRAFYSDCGIQTDPDALAQLVKGDQSRINAGDVTYNQVVSSINELPSWKAASQFQTASMDDIYREQKRNEFEIHRNVGLVVETRPDLINRDHLTMLRRFGCTKIQIGIQSLSDDVLSENTRCSSVESIAAAFDLLREFGFKSHVHFMVNLLGSNPEIDKAGYIELVEDPRFKPDEVKLYPCALVESSHLMGFYERGLWQPYSEEQLLDVLAFAVKSTPPFTRISRMIRDISSKDIVVGNKKTNLRQMVEAEIGEFPVSEMRMREIATEDVSSDELALEEVEYETSNSRELFLQWVTSDNQLAAFLRLSLPKRRGAPAMIREVHVYGKVSRIHEQKEGSQHSGLGRRLVGRACEIAAQSGFCQIDVISAVGTREYYRKLGFSDSGLYQSKYI